MNQKAGNLNATRDVAALNTEKTEGNRTSSHVSDDPVAALLVEILEELEKMNIHLSIITDEIVTNQEIE